MMHTLNKCDNPTVNMQKSTFTTVLLIAILLTGTITTASISVIDADAKEKKDKYQERDDGKNKEKRYDDYGYDSSIDYKKHEGKDKEKYDDYNEESDKYGSYTENQRDYDKPIKKVKIVNCNNRNINADGIEDINTIKPTLDKALALKKANDEATESISSEEFNSNPENSQVYYLGSDTKIIVKCNNENHFLSPSHNTDSETVTNDNIDTTEVLGNDSVDVTNDAKEPSQSDIKSLDSTSGVMQQKLQQQKLQQQQEQKEQQEQQKDTRILNSGNAVMQQKQEQPVKQQLQQLQQQKLQQQKLQQQKLQQQQEQKEQQEQQKDTRILNSGNEQQPSTDLPRNLNRAFMEKLANDSTDLTNDAKEPSQSDIKSLDSTSEQQPSTELPTNLNSGLAEKLANKANDVISDAKEPSQSDIKSLDSKSEQQASESPINPTSQVPFLLPIPYP